MNENNKICGKFWLMVPFINRISIGYSLTLANESILEVVDGAFIIQVALVGIVIGTVTGPLCAFIPLSLT